MRDPGQVRGPLDEQRRVEHQFLVLVDRAAHTLAQFHRRDITRLGQLHRGVERLQQGEATQVAQEHDAPRRDAGERQRQHAPEIVRVGEVLHDRVEHHEIEGLADAGRGLVRRALLERHVKEPESLRLTPKPGHRDRREIRPEICGAARRQRQQQHARPAADLPHPTGAQRSDAIDGAVSPHPHHLRGDRQPGVTAGPARDVERRLTDHRTRVGLVVHRPPGVDVLVLRAGRTDDGAGDDERDEVRARDHGGVLDPGVRPQGGLDLAELDTKPAQLDLLIEASEKFELAIATHAHPIAGTIHTCARPPREGIGDKSLERQLGPV